MLNSTARTSFGTRGLKTGSKAAYYIAAADEFAKMATSCKAGEDGSAKDDSPSMALQITFPIAATLFNCQKIVNSSIMQLTREELQVVMEK